MLDHLRLAVKVMPIYALQMPASDVWHFTGASLADLGLSCGSRSVSLDDDGRAVARDLYIPYDSLGSDYSDMAIKFYHQTKNTLPYIELKASPAKLLQGHNVYGSDDIEQGAFEMLGLLIESFPKLCAYLNFYDVEVLHLDCTYSATLPSQSMVQPCIDYLSNISFGHAVAQNVSYKNYTRWGRQDSRYLGRKAYGKYDEVKSQINDLLKKGVVTNQEKNKLQALQGALDFANARLRFESRICKTYLSKNDYPTNLYDLIKLQRQKPNLIQHLWGCAFRSIFDTLKGIDMTFDDDDKVRDHLRSKLFTVTKKGNISYTKANNLYDFYKALKSDGYQKVKDSYFSDLTGKSIFYKKVSLLVSCGFKKSDLQNLHSQKPKVIPMSTLIHLDFDNQVPADFVAPVSRFSNPANLAPSLRFVA